MAGIGKAVTTFLDIDDWKRALGSGEAILKSNEAINPLHSGGMMSGIPRSIYNIRHANQGFVDAVKTAHTREGGGLDPVAIAGSYIGVSAGYRILSGGGVTRDAQGNPNIIGIPFV